MATKVSDDLVSTVRSVVSSDYSEIYIIRALYMANLDPTASINIIFDTPSFSKVDVAIPSPSGSNGGKRVENGIKDCRFGEGGSVGENHRVEEGESINGGEESVSGNEWWLMGCSELVFTFAHSKKSNSEITPGKRFGWGRPALRMGSDIVRFSTKD